MASLLLHLYQKTNPTNFFILYFFFMFQRNSAFLGLIAFALLGTTACSKDESKPNDTPVSVSATLNAAQQIPVRTDSTVVSAATGTMTGTYTPADKKLTYTITYQGFRAGGAPNAGHLHLGVPKSSGGVNGANFYTLPNVGTSPITGTATLTQAQADALLANGVYVNLHTPRYGSGEIRGDIKK